jgi:hypothetical protein
MGLKFVSSKAKKLCLVKNLLLLYILKMIGGNPSYWNEESDERINGRRMKKKKKPLNQ